MHLNSSAFDHREALNNTKKEKSTTATESTAQLWFLFFFLCHCGCGQEEQAKNDTVFLPARSVLDPSSSSFPFPQRFFQTPALVHRDASVRLAL